MPKPKKEKKDIQLKVLAVLKPEDKFKNRLERFQAVRWIVEGKEGETKIERREFHIKVDGSESMGKAKGLNQADCRYIAAHWDELQMWF